MDRIDRVLDKFIQKRNQVLGNTNPNAKDYEKPCSAWLAGYKVLGENSARVILGSSNEIELNEAIYAVPHVTNGEMTAFAASFTPMVTDHTPGTPKIYYASIYAVKPRVHFRKATDDVLAKCRMISSTEYLDEQLEKVWERREINGQSYLVRVNELNPEAILKTSLMAKTDTSFTVNSDNFIISNSAKPGDYVEFFALAPSADNKGDVTPFLDVAEVVNNNGDSVDIQIKDGNFTTNATVSAHAIRSVIKASGTSSRQEVMDYLYKAYGDRWKDLVIKTGAFNVNDNGQVI